MKILIAVDMEGITGVLDWSHVDPGHAEYQRFRRLMTGDVNAAVQGASDGGADQIIVCDGHWNGNNILIEELNPKASLISGGPSQFSMVEGIQTGVDAAIFVGYHAHIGTQNAILDHTWSSSRVANLWINGRISGEFGLNGLVCGHFGAPVLMVSGDQSVCAEAEEWTPGVEKVIVKRAVSRCSAECLPPPVSQKLIQSGAERAIKRLMLGLAPQPLKASTPVTMTLEFIYSDMADRAVLLPGVKRLDGRKIEFQSPDMAQAYTTLRAAIMLGLRA